MLRHAGVAIAGVVLWGGSLGCQAILGIEDTNVGGDVVGQPGFTFAVLTSNVALPLDGKATIDVEIARAGGFEGDVEVRPTFTPTGR
jgi:hypothetical protein